MINDKNSQNAAIFIEPANQSDLTAILNLLTESGLLQEGLSDHLTTALVARAGQDVIGSAALELYGQAALLRSVAIAPVYRGQGLGQRLIQNVLELAQQRGLTHLYLLTDTAGKFC